MLDRLINWVSRKSPKSPESSSANVERESPKETFKIGEVNASLIGARGAVLNDGSPNTADGYLFNKNSNHIIIFDATGSNDPTKANECKQLLGERLKSDSQDLEKPENIPGKCIEIIVSDKAIHVGAEDGIVYVFRHNDGKIQVECLYALCENQVYIGGDGYVRYLEKGRLVTDIVTKPQPGKKLETDNSWRRVSTLIKNDLGTVICVIACTDGFTDEVYRTQSTKGSVSLEGMFDGLNSSMRAYAAQLELIISNNQPISEAVKLLQKEIILGEEVYYTNSKNNEDDKTIVIIPIIPIAPTPTTQ